MSERIKYSIPVVVLLLLIKDNKILLMRRQNTGWCDGDYDLIGGHIDGHETLTEAGCREAKEEVGVTIRRDDLSFVHLLDYVDSSEYLYAFFSAHTWEGEPTILEQEKCDDLRWFPLDALPENIAPATGGVIEKYKAGEYYTELEFHRVK
jgi:8-oxo-dGTP diphosphatase